MAEAITCATTHSRKFSARAKKNSAVGTRDRLRTRDRTLIHGRSRAIYESINPLPADFLTDVRARREKRRRRKEKKRKREKEKERINAAGKLPSPYPRFSMSNQAVRKRVEDVINSPCPVVEMRATWLHLHLHYLRRTVVCDGVLRRSRERQNESPRIRTAA